MQGPAPRLLGLWIIESEWIRDMKEGDVFSGKTKFDGGQRGLGCRCQ